VNSRKSKVGTIEDYRKGFSDGVLKDENGTALFAENIGSVTASPADTPFNETSYAYRHNNSLFVTIDAFKRVGDGTENFMDKKRGLGGEGVYTCDVDGEHLQWFDNVLEEAEQDTTIKHIFVQAHLPILQPVRKVSTSGQFMDYAEESSFWKVMNKYKKVDVYFAGDVHSNTASVGRDPNSSVVQIVTRGNPMSNFLSVITTEDVVNITLWNEAGPKTKWNDNYIEYGRLVIDKSGSKPVIESSGELTLLDPDSVLIKFDFDEIVPLDTRQVCVIKEVSKTVLLSSNPYHLLSIRCTLWMQAKSL
jgi:hypothetical protein